MSFSIESTLITQQDRALLTSKGVTVIRDGITSYVCYNGRKYAVRLDYGTSKENLGETNWEEVACKVALILVKKEIFKPDAAFSGAKIDQRGIQLQDQTLIQHVDTDPNKNTFEDYNQLLPFVETPSPKPVNTTPTDAPKSTESKPIASKPPVNPEAIINATDKPPVVQSESSTVTPISQKNRKILELLKINPNEKILDIETSSDDTTTSDEADDDETAIPNANNPSQNTPTTTTNSVVTKVTQPPEPNFVDVTGQTDSTTVVSQPVTLPVNDSSTVQTGKRSDEKKKKKIKSVPNPTDQQPTNSTVAIVPTEGNTTGNNTATTVNDTNSDNSWTSTFISPLMTVGNYITQKALFQ